MHSTARRRVCTLPALVAAAVLAAALLSPTAAHAHGTLVPATVAAGSSQRFELTVPNDRQDADIVGVALQLPPGARVELAEASQPRWAVASTEDVVTWTGGPIERGSAETFAVTLRMPSDAGRGEFALLETYDDGDAAPFPIAVTLTEPISGVGDSTSTLAVVALVVALLALGAATVALGLAIRLRKPP